MAANGMGFANVPSLGPDPFHFPDVGIGAARLGDPFRGAGRERAGAGPGVSGRRVLVFLFEAVSPLGASMDVNGLISGRDDAGWLEKFQGDIFQGHPPSQLFH